MTTLLASKTSPTLDATHFKFPVGALASGEIWPNSSETHGSWSVCEDWDDPTAPRSGYVRASQKQKQTKDGLEWIEFNASGMLHDADRALILLRDQWSLLRIRAEFESFDAIVGTTLDDPRAWFSKVGIVFGQRTSRHYWLFCVEGASSICLYQREDDKWTLIHRKDADDLKRRLVFEIEISATSLHASCLEAKFNFRCAWHDTFVGMAGFRSLGHSRLYQLEGQGHSLSIYAPSACDSSFEEEPYGFLKLQADEVVLRSIRLHSSGQSILLAWSPRRLFAMDWRGKLLWEYPGCFIEEFVRISIDHKKLYAVRASAWAVSKRTPCGIPIFHGPPERLDIIETNGGTLVASLPLPEDPELAPDVVAWPNAPHADWDVSAESGMGTTAGEIDFVLRREFWDGWRTIWAYDNQCNLLWRRRTRLPYGHHFAVRICDLDGDGEYEVIAGGTAFRRDGTLWWEHDQGNELIRSIGGGHYDATWISSDPVSGGAAKIFLLAGSPGLFILDPLTGKTLKHLHIGHAQTALKARLTTTAERIIVVTRWGNPGIITAFDFEGRRLWARQPDFIGQGCLSVYVPSLGHDLLWTNTSETSQGLYDDAGNSICELPKIRALWKGRRRREMKSVVLSSGASGKPDILCVQRKGEVYFFAIRKPTF